ncbi:hypothetical protein ABW21_db0206670 [Orbilia brochopaga]|nr:hypothetical protein ABW21_db0206670 [Drechslerella brochopaga]
MAYDKMYGGPLPPSYDSDDYKSFPSKFPAIPTPVGTRPRKVRTIYVPIFSRFFGHVRIPQRQNIYLIFTTAASITLLFYISRPSFLSPRSASIFDSNFDELALQPAGPHDQLMTEAGDASTASGFPKKIWQIRLEPLGGREAQTPSEQDIKRTASWQNMNPSYRYELLNDTTAERYIAQNFKDIDPYLVQLYPNFPQRILAADLLRYMIMYRSGGVYTDLDTECKMPIDRWMDESLSNVPGVRGSDINMIIGMDQATRWSDDFANDGEIDKRIQFVQWTIYARPGHEIIRRMIQEITTSVRRDIESLPSKSVSALYYEQEQILNRTGPWQWTRAVQRYINDLEGKKVPIEEFADIDGARRFGDVLFVSAGRMNPGPAHSGVAYVQPFLAHHKASSWRGT